MKFPAVFGKTRSVSTGPRPRRPQVLDGRPAQTLTEIALQVPRQEKSLWCWAAVGSGIARYFGLAVPSQCQVAGEVLGREPGSCCTRADNSCNQFGYLNHTLAHFRCFDRFDGPAGAGVIETEMKAKRPLGVRVEWTSGLGRGTGHFMAIAGIGKTQTGDTVVIKDPIDGSTMLIALSLLTTRYGPGKGRWTHSFYTLPPGEAALAGGGGPRVLGRGPCSARDNDPGLRGG